MPARRGARRWRWAATLAPSSPDWHPPRSTSSSRQRAGDVATRTEAERPAYRRLAVAGAAALVFLAGMAARGAVGDRGESQPQTDAAPTDRAAATAGPTGEVDGTPAGFAQSRSGARDAAIAYTATLSQRLLYLEPDGAEAAVRGVAAEASADTLANDVLAGLR